MGDYTIVFTRKGRFVSFEGGEGAGKSTQIELLAQFLKSVGITVITTREPGGSETAEEIRKLLLGGKVNRWDSMTETLLLMASRRSHLRDLINPALQNGTWVLCDRFIHSTIAYQGYGLGLDIKSIKILQDMAIGEFIPDMTILLDISVELGLKRANSRGLLTRYEQMDKSTHIRIRNGFLKLADDASDRFIVVDASASIKVVRRQIIDAVNRYFDLN